MAATARHPEGTGSPPTLHLALELGPDFPERLREVRLWDGEPLQPDLRARLEREWKRRERVCGEIRAWTSNVKSGSGEPTATQRSSKSDG